MLALIDPAEALLASITDERTLTDEQFAMVAAYAASPPPALPMAGDQDVRAVIGALSTVKKRRNSSYEEGKLQLGLYRKVLVGIPAAALKHAGEVFLRQSGWMPEPAEMLEEAKRYLAPEHRLHNRARYLARERGQRQFDDRCKALRNRTFPVDQFHTLSPQEIRIGLHERALLQELDGSLIPWSLEDEHRISASLAQTLEEIRDQDEPSGAHNERGTRAIDGSGSAGIGGAIRGVMAGVEVGDGI